MWYVIQVMTGEEKITIDMCNVILQENELYEFFIPEAERKRKVKGKWHNIRKPMFPGYVFISTENMDKLYEELRNVPKLTKVLGTDHTVTPISPSEENLIKRLTNKQHIAEISVGYIEGDRLIISEGPMMGMEAMVKKIDRHKRIAVLSVTMFGNSTDVTMGLEVLSKD